MTWSEKHSQSATLSETAHRLVRAGDIAAAQTQYRQAAEFELEALAALPPDRQRTYGVTAVSALSLLYKSGARQDAADLGLRFLADPFLSEPFREEIKAILETLEPTQNRAAPARPFYRRAPRSVSTPSKETTYDKAEPRNVKGVPPGRA